MNDFLRESASDVCNQYLLQSLFTWRKFAGTSKPEIRVPTTVAGPSTPGTGIWWNVRLPKHITPKHYDVTIFVDLKKFLFNGYVSILIEVKEPTEYILVHTNKLAVTSLDVLQSSGGKYSLFNIDKVCRNNIERYSKLCIDSKAKHRAEMLWTLFET